MEEWLNRPTSVALWIPPHSCFIRLVKLMVIKLVQTRAAAYGPLAVWCPGSLTSESVPVERSCGLSKLDCVSFSFYGIYVTSLFDGILKVYGYIKFLLVSI